MLRSCLDDGDDHADNTLFNEKSKDQRFYTKYKFELSDLRIVYSDSSISIYLSLRNNRIDFFNCIDRKRLFILQRTPLIDMTFYKCIYSNDANLTK